MNGKLKKELSECFPAPEPRKKKAFLSKIPMPRAKMLFLPFYPDFFHKKTGMGSVHSDFCRCRSGNLYHRPECCMDCFLPCSVPGDGSCDRKRKIRRLWNGELEQSARFSLKSVVMARFLILGIF